MQRFLINRFEVHKVLRRSGNMVSFLARDRWTDADAVVVKCVRAGTFVSGTGLERQLAWSRGFQHRQLSRLDYAGYTPRGDFYSVRVHSDHVPWPVDQPSDNRVEALIAACRLLQRHGFVHGRIKPSNILVDRDDVQLVDGGLPRTRPEHLDASAVHFTAPELLLGGQPRLDADLYSLGATLYQSYARRTIFNDSNVDLLRYKYLHAAPVPLHEAADVTRNFSCFVMRLIDPSGSVRRQALSEWVSGRCLNTMAAERAALVGRRGELKTMMKLLNESKPGVAAAIVEADAGVGKTRFIRELAFRAEFRQRAVFVVRSHERNDRCFEPILQVIDQCFKRQETALADWFESEGRAYEATIARLLPDLPVPARGDSGASPPTTEKMVADLAGALIRLSRRFSPFRVVFDDSHWWDDGTVRVMEQLLLRAGESSWIFVFTARSNRTPLLLRQLLVDDPRPDVTAGRIRLGPLSKSETLSMARSVSLDTDRLEWIAHQSGGIPLLVEEYSRYEGARTRRLLPRSRDLLLRTFRALAPEVRRVAEILSCHSEPMPRRLLERAAAGMGVRALPSSVAALQDCGIVEERDELVAYRHDGVREAIHDSVDRTRRRNLHQWLYRDLACEKPDDERLGFHASNSNLTSEAISAYEGSSNRRLNQRDFHSATELLSTTRTLYRRLKREVPAHLDLSYAECLVQVGKVQPARRILNRIRTRNGLSPALRVQLYRGLCACDPDRPENHVRDLEAAVLHPEIESRSLFEALMQLGNAYAASGRSAAAVAILQRCDSLSRNLSLVDKRGYLVRKAGVLAVLHRPAEALAAMDAFDRIETSRNAGLAPSALENRGMCLSQLGRIAEAIDCHERAVHLARERKLVVTEAVNLRSLGACQTVTGRFIEAVPSFSRGEALLLRSGVYGHAERTHLAILAANKAVLETYTGRYAAAQESIASAKRRLRGRTTGLARTLTALTAAELYRRTHQTARFREAVESLRSNPMMGADFMRVELALISGLAGPPGMNRTAGLEAALATSLKLGTRHQQCRILIVIAESRLRSNEIDAARAGLREAARLARRFDLGVHRPRIALRIAQALESRRDRIRYATVARRMAQRLPEPEIQAEAEVLIAAVERSRGNASRAYEHAKAAADIATELAGQIPARSRGPYLNSSWRKEAREMLEGMKPSTELRSAPSVSHTLIHDYLKALRDASTSLSGASDIDECAKAIIRAVSRLSRQRFVVYLNVHDAEDFLPKKANLDAGTCRRIASLHKRFPERTFFGRHDVRPTTRPGPPFVAWIPFAYRKSQFGGLYVERSDRTLPELEIDYLVALGGIASSALAATLESVPAKTKPESVDSEFPEIIGSSRAITRVRKLIRIAAGSTATVLIEGESGTGKELVAQAIHANSSRSGRSLVTVDCGSVSETLIESELFGSRRGAFTGASVDRHGLIEEATGGTLFLDEISNMSPSLQAKLLRVLEEREVRRVGDTTGRPVDVRLIAATNQNLEKLVRQGEFRGYLLYRLKVLHVQVPPLRQRREDIPELAHDFIRRLNSMHGTRKKLAPVAMENLSACSFPGNIRELKNVVERSYFMTTDGATIRRVAVDTGLVDVDREDEIQEWFEDIRDGRQNFWSAVHTRYKERDISREKVMALMDVGLRATRGSYKSLASLFRVKDTEYRKFMDFLRRNRCQPDFRPYRKLPVQKYARGPDA